MSVSPSPSSTRVSTRQRPPVAAAILAAGLGCRMGALNKLVQPIDGVPMVRTVALEALASSCERVFVVLGHQAALIREALSGLELEFIDNADYHEGLAASVRTAAGAIRAGEALMICLGDMPRVSADTIDRLIRAYHDGHGNLLDTGGRSQATHPNVRDQAEAASKGQASSQADVAAYQPSFDGRRGNPVLWTPGAVSLLAALSGDEGARSVLKNLGDAVAAVPVQSDGIFMDVDTPEALQAARRQEKFPRT